MLNLVGQIKTVLIAEWEGEGEVGRCRLWIGKHVAELKCKLIIIIEERRDFCHDSSPFLLLGRHHSEGRF